MNERSSARVWSVSPSCRGERGGGGVGGGTETQSRQGVAIFFRVGVRVECGGDEVGRARHCKPHIGCREETGCLDLSEVSQQVAGFNKIPSDKMQLLLKPSVHRGRRRNAKPQRPTSTSSHSGLRFATRVQRQCLALKTI